MDKITPSLERPPIKRPNRDSFSISETNTMEINLMRRSGLNKAKWIKKYGKRFREIVEDGELNKILLDLYFKSPRLAEDYIENELREKGSND